MTSTKESKDLELKKAASTSASGSSVNNAAKKQYSQINEADETVEMEEDLAVSIDPAGIRPQTKATASANTKNVSADEEDSEDEDSDDIDAELNKLEQSVVEDNGNSDDEDESAAAPYDRSLKKKK